MTTPTLYMLSNRTYDYKTNKFHDRGKLSDRGIALYSTTNQSTFIRYTTTKSKTLFSADDTWYVIYLPDTYGSMPDGFSQNSNVLYNDYFTSASNSIPFQVIPFMWPCDTDPLDNKNKAEISGFDLFRYVSTINGKISSTSKLFVVASGVGACIYRNCTRYLSRYDHVLFDGVYLLEPDISNTALDPDHEGKYMTMSAKEIVVYYNKDSTSYSNGFVQNRMSIGGVRNLSQTECIISQVDCTNLNRSINSCCSNIRLHECKPVHEDIISCMMRTTNPQRSIYSDRSFILQ